MRWVWIEVDGEEWREAELSPMDEVVLVERTALSFAFIFLVFRSGKGFGRWLFSSVLLMRLGCFSLLVSMLTVYKG